MLDGSRSHVDSTQQPNPQLDLSVNEAKTFQMKMAICECHEVALLSHKVPACLIEVK